MKNVFVMIVIWFLCLVAAVFSLVWLAAAILCGSRRAMNVAIAMDQAANAAIGGHEDVTISSRAWQKRNESKRWHYARIFIDKLFFFEPNHCEMAFKNEVERSSSWRK